MWLVESEIRTRLLKAEAEGLLPTAEQREELFARFDASMGGTIPAIMSVAGDKAQIEIKGLLTNAPNFLAMIFGGGNTTYPEIIAALGAAESDDDISEIILSIDSPGGSSAGLFDTLNVISKTKKPIHAVVSNTAASAAYGIASQADDISVSNQAAMVGSIGIATKFLVSDSVVEIASSEAPKKRPDVTTPEGVKVVQEQLDALHKVFAEAIASGRSNATGKSFSVNDVNKDFGQGSMLIAAEALEKGMIDNIEQKGPQVAGPSSNIGAVLSKVPQSVDKNRGKILKTNKQSKREGKGMDLKELKADHREIYDAAVQVGKEAGVAEERDRVVAHIKMGESTGAMKEASEAITKGIGFNSTMQATYMSAGMKKGDIAARDNDNAVAEGALAGSGGVEGKDAEDQVSDIVAAGLGFKETGTEGGVV